MAQNRQFHGAVSLPEYRHSRHCRKRAENDKRGAVRSWKKTGQKKVRHPAQSTYDNVEKAAPDGAALIYSGQKARWRNASSEKSSQAVLAQACPCSRTACKNPGTASVWPDELQGLALSPVTLLKAGAGQEMLQPSGQS